MIGTNAFLYELPFMLAFGIAPLFVVAWYLRAWLRLGRLPSSGMRVAVFVLVMLVLGIVVVNNFAHEFYVQYKLRTLDSVVVQSILVDQREFTDPKDIATLLNSIRRVQWFTSMHGGWDRPIVFAIRMKSGQTFDFSIANYERRNGSVIHFNSLTPPPRVHFIPNHGSAFQEDLPRILSSLGVDLPGYNRAGAQR